MEVWEKIKALPAWQLGLMAVAALIVLCLALPLITWTVKVVAYVIVIGLIIAGGYYLAQQLGKGKDPESKE